MTTVLDRPTTSTYFSDTWAQLQQAPNALEKAIDVLFTELKTNGFVRFSQLFTPEIMAQAKAEIETCYQQDLAERHEQEVTQAHHKLGQVGHSVLTKPSHLMLNMFGMAPTADQLFEAFLSHPVTAGVLRKLAGPSIKLRGYNIRRMTGAYDPSPIPGKVTSIPHEWHIDSPGELCVSFLYTDVETLEDSPTAFIPGSHLFPYNPRTECLFSRNSTYEDEAELVETNIFSTLLGKRYFNNVTGGTGQAGDAMLFINDTLWHGRHPNTRGKESMISFIGLFSSSFEFPDNVPVPDEATLAKLPPKFRAVVDQSMPVSDEPSYIQELQTLRHKVGFLDLFHLAQLERRYAERASKKVRAKLLAQEQQQQGAN